MKLSWRIELAHWLVLAGMFAAAAVQWGSLPDRIPVHFNLEGEPDRWGGKFEGLLLLPLLALGIYFVALLLPRIDPGRANYARFAGVYALIRLLVTLTLAAVQAAMILSFHRQRADLGPWVQPVVGAALLVLGSVMGKIRPNWFVGIRTPWTLSSKTSWLKTHRLGGWLFIGMGLVVGLSPWLARGIPAWILLFGLPAATCAWLVVYSYLVWRSDPHRIAPAGTVPDEEPSPTGESS
jgi:uncharacterized membrane protein